MTNALEIMAPAGSREALAAAIQAGADSVYFGIEALNMRAHSASRFTVADLPDIVARCQAAGVKSYLTVNTIIYEDDLPLMRRICDAARAAGVTAIIAADVAVLAYCHDIGQEVHLSTQLNISNTEALRFYARYADVVVLARELNLDQVAQIHRCIVSENLCGPSGRPVRIEMFCHGALCMAVSGSADHFNTMTASWGGLGFLWNKPVAFVFVRPERYTHDFIEANDRLTLAFLGEEGRDALKYCGSHSGRDADKMAATGLTPLTVADDAVTFAQARLTLVCRKLYKDAMRAEAFIDKACLERWYNDQPGGGLHDVYVVEIEAVYER